MKHAAALALSCAMVGKAAYGAGFLLGVISSTDSAQSIALFAKDGGGSDGLRIGQSVAGWRLASIQRDRVVLQKPPHELVLRAGDSLGGEGRPLRGLERRGATLAISRELRDHIKSGGLVSVLMQAASEPAYVNGEMVGYRIFEIDAGSAYDLAGIKNGDVVTHIDGVCLTNPWVALSMLRQVADVDSFEYTLTRYGTASTTKIQVGL